MNSPRTAFNAPIRFRPLTRALTLLELLVVVTILAILTTVATRSLVSVGEQTQFDSNERLALDFKRALAGVPNSLQSDGTPSITGFIADHGRPPRAELENYSVGENEISAGPTGQAYTLRELTIQRSSPAHRLYVTDAATVTATSVNLTMTGGTTNVAFFDSTNRVPAGWRGPYLLAGNDSMLKDAWNKPIAAYSTISDRTFVDFWTATYDNDGTQNPQLPINPAFPTAGYHAIGYGVGRGPLDVVGIVVRTGPAVDANYSSLSQTSYSNTFSSGIVFTNDFVAELLCNITFNTNSSLGTEVPWGTTRTNYNIAIGVIMYGPNPFFGSPLFSSTFATNRPVAASFISTMTLFNNLSHLVAPPANELSSFPSTQALTFTNNPIRFGNVIGTPGASATYPLVVGAKVLKPVMVAIRKSSVTTGPTAGVYYGSARSIVVRPGYNTVQLSIP